MTEISFGWVPVSWCGVAFLLHLLETVELLAAADENFAAGMRVLSLEIETKPELLSALANHIHDVFSGRLVDSSVNCSGSHRHSCHKRGSYKSGNVKIGKQQLTLQYRPSYKPEQRQQNHVCNVPIPFV